MVRKALSIAGFDGSGGAGLQADLKTFSAFGCYGMTVLTALPVQNTQGVRNCYPIPLKAVEEQLSAIFDDIRPDVIKVGMLFNSDVINYVADFLAKYAYDIPIVLDPVMVAKSGDDLLDPPAVSTLIEKILPLVTIVTPNYYEAEKLALQSINSCQDICTAARRILQHGAKAVLLKGGHSLDNDCDDLLLYDDKEEWLKSKRIDTINNHGTGCTLSAAIASGLGLGLSIPDSCKLAKRYISMALASFENEKIGKGHGPVNHFYHLWPSVDLI